MKTDHLSPLNDADTRRIARTVVLSLGLLTATCPKRLESHQSSNPVWFKPRGGGRGDPMGEAGKFFGIRNPF